MPTRVESSPRTFSVQELAELRRLDTVRQKRIGGTSGAWGGRCYPLDAIDFEARDHVPHSGWPSNGRCWIDFYVRANATQRPVNMSMSGACLSHGARLLGWDTGDSKIDDSRIWRFSRPTDFGKTYRAKLRDDSHIRLYFHGTALWLDIDGTDGCVRAVVAASAPGREFRVEADTSSWRSEDSNRRGCFLSLPALWSQRSGRGMSLGRYYMTHLDGIVGKVRFRTTVPEGRLLLRAFPRRCHCRRLVRLKDEVQTTNDSSI